MSFNGENLLYRIAAGRSRFALRIGQAAFALAVVAVPFLFQGFLNVYAKSRWVWFTYLLCAMTCVIWLTFANEVRKFSSGERMLNPFKGTDVVIHTIGNLQNDAFARWSMLLFNVLAILGIGWVAVNAA